MIIDKIRRKPDKHHSLRCQRYKLVDKDMVGNNLCRLFNIISSIETDSLNIV